MSRPVWEFSRVEETYNSGVDKCAPATLFLEKGQDEGNGGGTKEDQDELIFELLENKLPNGSRRLLRDSCRYTMSVYQPCGGRERGMLHTILAVLLAQGGYLRIRQACRSLNP